MDPCIKQAPVWSKWFWIILWPLAYNRLELDSIRKIINFWYTFGWKWRVFVTIWDCRTHVRMTSSVERTDLDFKISVALVGILSKILDYRYINQVCQKDLENNGALKTYTQCSGELEMDHNTKLSLHVKISANFLPLPFLSFKLLPAFCRTGFRQSRKIFTVQWHFLSELTKIPESY